MYIMNDKKNHRNSNFNDIEVSIEYGSMNDGISIMENES